MVSRPELDPSQRAVLALPAGRSAVVLGAPGSGRTTTLVELAADRIEAGMPTSAVLAIDPRRTSAARLRDRLVLRIGRPVTAPLARTAASLAFEIARSSAAADGREPPVLLAGSEQDTLISELIADSRASWPEALGPDVRALPAFRSELRELWARATERGYGPDELAAAATAAGRHDWAAAAEFWRDYLDVLIQTHPDAYDAAELAALAATAVEAGRGGPVADALRLVLVDDVQDATESTVRLLAALAARGVTVVAFGDPDVASDTFRGGEPDLAGAFGARLGIDAARLVLDRVHRQPLPLRQFVRGVTERIGTALAGEQRAAAGVADRPAALRTFTAGSGAELALGVARLVRERHLHGGVPWSEIAVVVRSGALAEPIARALGQVGVPARTTVTGRPLAEDPAARALLDVLAVGCGVVELTAEVAVGLLCGPLCGLDRLGLRRLRLALRAEELAGDGVRASGVLLVEALAAPGRLVTIDSGFGRRAARLAETLHLVRERAAAGDSAEELLWLAWERSGLAATWYDQSQGTGALADQAGRALDAVVALFTAATRAAERAPNDPATVFLLEQLEATVRDDTLSPRTAESSVLVSSPAGVASLEFDTVVLAGLQEGVWPDLRARGSLLGAGDFVRFDSGATGALDTRRQTLSDELRLFALGASRARSRLVFAAVENDEEDPGVLFGLAGAIRGDARGCHDAHRPARSRRHVAPHRRDRVGCGAAGGRRRARRTGGRGGRRRGSGGVAGAAADLDRRAGRAAGEHGRRRAVFGGVVRGVGARLVRRAHRRVAAQPAVRGRHRAALGARDGRASRRGGDGGRARDALGRVRVRGAVAR